MVRFLTIGITGLILAAVASAGQIEIGAGTNGSKGLTNNYITVAGSVPTNLGGFTEQNYVNAMFENAVSIPPTTAPFTGYTTTGTIAAGDTMKDSAADGGKGVTFAMIAGDSSNGTSANFWQGASGATPADNEITIPVGVYGVADVWTMINLIDGSNSMRDANIYFNFGAAATGTIATTVEVKLGDSGATVSASPAGQLQDGVLCSGCSGDNGPTLGTSNPNTVPAGAGVTVITDNIYDQFYSNVCELGVGSIGCNGGNVVLDDQGFIFSGSALSTSGDRKSVV